MSSEQLGVPLAQAMLTPGTGLFLSPPNAVKLADKRSTAWGLSMVSEAKLPGFKSLFYFLLTLSSW